MLVSVSIHFCQAFTNPCYTGCSSLHFGTVVVHKKCVFMYWLVWGASVGKPLCYFCALIFITDCSSEADNRMTYDL